MYLSGRQIHPLFSFIYDNFNPFTITNQNACLKTGSPLSAYFFQNRIPAESFFFLQLIPRTAVFPDKLICHMLNHTFFSASIVHLDIRYHSIIIFRIHGTVFFHFQMVQIVCDCFDFLYIGQLIPRFSRSGRYGDPGNRTFRQKPSSICC